MKTCTMKARRKESGMLRRAELVASDRAKAAGHEG